MSTAPSVKTSSEPLRTPWSAPRLLELPKLVRLTLASAIGGTGGTGGGGSTVFGLLVSLLLGGLAACTSDRQTGPGDDHPTQLSQAITCRVSVADVTVSCDAPQMAPDTELVGGQGVFVALRSVKPHYDNGLEQFDFDVTVQNLSTQTLGSDGAAKIGFAVFFVAQPVITSGSGTITTSNQDGTQDFTATNQPYFGYADSLASGDTSATRNWVLNVPSTVNSFTFTVLVAAMVPEFSGVMRWHMLAEFASDGIVDIAVNSPTDAMAVGTGGVTFRKTGSTWDRLPPQIFENWVGVEPIGDGRYIGATDVGTVALFDGKIWRRIHTAMGPITTLGAWSDTKIAVGGGPVEFGGVPGYDYVEWTNDSVWKTWVLAPGAIKAIVPFAPNNFAAFRQSSMKVWIYAFDNTNPQQIVGPFVEWQSAYGWVGTGYGGAAYNNGTHAGVVMDQTFATLWSATDTFPDAVELGAGADLWLAARSTVTDSTTLMSLSGSTWSDRAYLHTQVRAMKQDSAGGLYLASNEGIRHWNGSALVDELVAQPGDFLTRIGMNGNDAMVGTGLGFVWHYTPFVWAKNDVDLGHADPIAALAMYGHDSAAAADNVGRVHEFDGVSWSQINTFTAPVTDILGFAGGDLLVVGGNGSGGGAAHRRDAGSWSTTSDPGGAPNGTLRAVWGLSMSDYWVVGDSGKVAHYSGGSYALNMPGTTNHLYAVTGHSSSDLWVAGQNGYIAHWDGAGWTVCTLGTSTIRALWSPAPGIVYAAADSDSMAWEAPLCNARTVRIPTAPGGVSGVVGTSASNVWAIKGGRVYRGTR